jgi:hypothetical protein
MGDDMIFWDEMWNFSSKDNIKKKDKDGTITKDSLEDSQMESKDKPA